MCSWVERVEGILGVLLQFCQRNSSKLASEEKARQVQARAIYYLIPPSLLPPPPLPSPPDLVLLKD